MENKTILRGDFMKYDIKKTDYNDKKAIGYYSFLVTNCIQHYIEVLEVKSGYDNIIIYRAVKAIDDSMKKSGIRIARINDKLQFNCYDYNKKRHCISFNKIMRF